MWLANPAFLRQEPPRQVQLALLLTLLWVALPLLWSLPPGVIALFGALWLHEPVTPSLLGALVLVAAGIVLVNRKRA